MASSAEAIESIRSFVKTKGEKLTLGQIIDKGGPDVAGRGYDRDTDVTLRGLDMRAFKDGRLSGRLACRAVLVEPSVSQRFITTPGGENVEDLLYLRTRFTYDVPNRSVLPTAPTLGGTVMQVAIHSLLLANGERAGDGAQLDDYYERLAAYETELRSGKIGPKEQAVALEPQMPDLHVQYGLALPIVPNLDGPDRVRTDSELLHDSRNAAFNRLQQEQLGARVLALATQGYVSETELSDWAEAFTSQAA